MYKYAAAAASMVLAVTISACGDGAYSGGMSPTAPDGAAPPPADAIVIDIVGDNGAQSFAPNPAMVPPGRTVVWHNVDRTTHRVLLDDRGVDAGNLAPGAYSAPMALPAAGPYHCTIHPGMVGALTR